MSGAELIGIISGIIAIVDASLKIYDAVEDASGLPQSFRNIIARLPVIQDTLQIAKEAIEEEENGEKPEISSVKSRQAMAQILGSCYDKAAALNEILMSIMPTKGASKTKRYIRAMKIFPTAEKVDNLMNGILDDVHVLAANHSVKTATLIKKNLMEAARKSERREHMRSRCYETITLCNTGRGSQFIYDGEGNQNISMGGLQLNGSSTAPIYIGIGG